MFEQPVNQPEVVEAIILPAMEEEMEEDTVIDPSTVQPAKPSSDDLIYCARRMIALWDDGFQWSDLPKMAQDAFIWLDLFNDMTEQERKDAVVKIFSVVIDETDTPHLPDQYTDPLFKAMVPPFVDLASAIYDGNFHLSQEQPPLGSLEMRSYIAKMKGSLSDGLQWSDLCQIISTTAEFVLPRARMTPQEKKYRILSIINQILDGTDTPYLPDTYVDPIFKALAKECVNLILPYD